MREIIKLFDIIGHKKITVFIFFLNLLVALVEFIGLSLIIPYISTAMSQKIPENKYVTYVVEFLNIETYQVFISYLSIVIVSFYVFRLILNVSSNYLSLRLFNKIRHIVMFKLFNHYTYLDYSDFVFRNSSDFKKTLLQESLHVQVIIKSMIDMVAELFVLLFLVSLIIYIDWKLALGLGLIFGLMFIIVTFLVKEKVTIISAKREKYGRGLHRCVDETLNGFKFIKLVGAEGVGIEGFEKNSNGLYQVNSLFQLINESPRFILETLGLISIVLITYYLVNFTSTNNLIATLGVYAAAFYRALPSLNRIISSYNNFQYFKNTIDQISECFSIKTEKLFVNETVVFDDELKLIDVSFRYKGTEDFLFSKLNVAINKGSKIAIVGKSGAGKSTFADILMGLLIPEQGNLIVDGTIINESNMKSWRNKFGYIPQEIYLYDATVAENIAFGREYNRERIIEVLKLSNIYDFLETESGLETMVGDGGVKLSGGQKQRIGIARAIYSDPEILVLDEATSGLDYGTESLIMDEIYEISKNKTLIVIAHRLSTIDKCEEKITL
ncbi:ABC transporter ATP-binding protein [Marinomonas colpomeniae]|uniref:ABC transporter ATP-binding protein n=1 Tax=Marinomonas colpomeniae TaxID=2774408 RepID=A0ABR8P040_9GAMM|nr:ABC transporter ATP-binding protein [Marinomonas colpomeniae]MBD5771114.1 ABC transporter ATP-binding protein [Marinomonas colpomeniae]